MAVDPSHLLNPRVVVAFVIQVVGYAALLAVYPHSEPSPVVTALQRLPSVLLVPFALPAVPATVLAVGLGTLLSLAGPSPASIPALLLSRGDVLFFASAYIVAVVAAWAPRRDRN